MTTDWAKNGKRLAAMAPLIWVVLFDPFGLSTRMDAVAQAVTSRIFAPTYTRPGASPARDHLALVSITAQTLAVPGHHFPTSYDEFAHVLTVAQAAGAKAVFLDFIFHREDEDAFGRNHLIAAAKKAKDSGMLVLAGPMPPGPWFADLRDAMPEAGVSWDGPTHPLDYPFVTKGGDGALVMTAAVRLYMTACGLKGDGPDCAARRPEPITGNLATMAKRPPIAVQFGLGPAPLQEQFTTPASLAACKAAAPRSWLRALGSGLIEGLQPPVRAGPCLYHLEIPLQSIDEPDALAALHGRIVVVGDGPDLGDVLTIPGAGKVGGGELHLMALDNLMTAGADYARWSGPLLWPQGPGPQQLLKLILAAPTPWLLDFLLRWAQTAKPGRRRLEVFAVLAVMVAIPLASAWFAAVVWRMPPGGFVAIGLLALTASVILENEEITRDLGLPKSAAGNIAGLLALIAAPLWLAALGSGQIAWSVAAAVASLGALGLCLAVLIAAVRRPKTQPSSA